MYVYLQSEKLLYTVGFYDPDGQWHPESDHSDREEAAKRVAFLNGTLRDIHDNYREPLKTKRIPF